MSTWTAALIVILMMRKIHAEMMVDGFLIGTVKDLNAKLVGTKMTIVPFANIFTVMRLNGLRVGLNRDAPEPTLIMFIENVRFYFFLK